MKRFIALAIAGVMAFAVVSVASGAGDQTQQTIDATITPTKLDKKQYKPATLFVDIETAPNDEHSELQQPPNVIRTQLDLPTNLKFDTSAVPRCAVSNDDLAGTTPEEAIAACGKASKVSVDSGTSAQVQIATGPDSSLFLDTAVTAFNGHAKDTIYLHSYQPDFGNTTILVGKLKNGPQGFGKMLDVTIPKLDAGGLSKFIVTVKAGKYVQARCKSKTNNFQARSTWKDDPATPTVNEGHTPTTGTDTTKCKQKKA